MALIESKSFASAEQDKSALLQYTFVKRLEERSALFAIPFVHEFPVIAKKDLHKFAHLGRTIARVQLSPSAILSFGKDIRATETLQTVTANDALVEITSEVWDWDMNPEFAEKAVKYLPTNVTLMRKIPETIRDYIRKEHGYLLQQDSRVRAALAIWQ